MAEAVATSIPTRDELVTKIMDAICDPKTGCTNMWKKRDQLKEHHDLLDAWGLESSSIGDAMDNLRGEYDLVTDDFDPALRENARTVGLIAELVLDALERKAAM